MRRTALRRASLFGLVGAALMLFTACGSSSGGTPPAKSNSYDFSYTAKIPDKKGGQVVFGDWQFPDTLNVIPGQAGGLVVDVEVNSALHGACWVQLPDLSLGESGWKPDQCTSVPTIANGGESKDGKTTTLKLDPKAKWSDGQPITADDYLLTYYFGIDPNVGGNLDPYDLWSKVTKVDNLTLQVDWNNPFTNYLENINAALYPLPLHQYNAGKYAGLYDAATQKYSSDIALKLVQDDITNSKITITNGPFTVQSFAADDSVVMAKNPNYFSNFFKGPFLDKVVFKSTGSKDVLIQAYKAGQYAHVENFTVADLPKFADIPAAETLVSPNVAFEHLEFNLRPDALNAKANGGTSIFADINVRQAFIQAFDRCRAIVAVLGVKDCNDPNISTNEVTTPPAAEFDPTVKIPGYDPVAAAKLLEDAGYKLVNGKRTYKDGKTPISIVLTSTNTQPTRDSFLALLRQAYTDLNITATVQTYKTSKLFTTFNDGGILSTSQYDVSLFTYSVGGDPDDGVGGYLTSQIPSAKVSAGNNRSGVADSNIDAQIAAGRQTFDPVKRLQIYKDLQKYISSQYYFEPLYIRANFSLTKTTLGNYKQQATTSGNEWNIADWYTTGS